MLQDVRAPYCIFIILCIFINIFLSEWKIGDENVSENPGID